MFCFFIYYDYKSSYISAEEEKENPKFWLLFASKFFEKFHSLVDMLLQALQ